MFLEGNFRHLKRLITNNAKLFFGQPLKNDIIDKNILLDKENKRLDSIINVENLTKEFIVNKSHSGFLGSLKTLFSRNYRVIKAINNINFEIKQGEFVGYVGENGAGKSTTIKILTGILLPTDGQALVNNVIPYKNRIKNAKKIGVVFGQRTQLWWDLPVRESFDLLKSVYHISSDTFKKNMDFFLDTLNIEDFFDVPVRKLSLGQRMRCDLAASLLHNPEILFLDEPTIGLDVIAKDKIRKFLTQINKDNNITIILTTHDMDDIEELCKRIIILDQGSIVFDNQVSKLKEKYGKERVLEIEFHKQYESLSKIKDINVFKEDENKKWIKFSSEKYTAASIISKIIENYEIKDISIHEPNVADIVKTLYEKSAVSNGTVS